MRAGAPEIRTSQASPRALGWAASAVYLLGQTELLETAIPGFPVIGWAGLAGSLLWLLWMVVMGVYLIKSKAESPQPATPWVMAKAVSSGRS